MKYTSQIIKDTKFNIDHISPLAAGGSNEESNLQILCVSCHRDKSSNEHEQGSYIKTKDTTSFFNAEVHEIMNSTLAGQHAFVEKVCYNVVDNTKKMFTIDINKCRRNILNYSQHDYCLFTCFDKSEPFEGSIINPGLYYLEFDDVQTPINNNERVIKSDLCNIGFILIFFKPSTSNQAIQIAKPNEE
jgi:hypothetical protein